MDDQGDILDVYFALLPETADFSPLCPPEREAETRILGENRQKERRAVWRLLEEAVRRSFGLSMEELRFEKLESGKWVCDRLFFSLSHCPGAVAAAVSGRPVGVDLESAARFTEGQPRLERLARRICGAGEGLPSPATPEAFLALWTKKESIFKRSGNTRFLPDRIIAAGYPTVSGTVSFSPAERFVFSVCAEHPEGLRCHAVSLSGEGTAGFFAMPLPPDSFHPERGPKNV